MHTFKTAPLELKFADSEQPGEFTGYAATFGGEPDAYGDVIAPGAFAKSLAKHGADGTRPALLWAHDSHQPIGVWLSLQENDEGLLATGKLALDVAKAREAYSLAKDGALALSIGYVVSENGAEIRNGARLLKQIDLREISLVPMPANPKARIHQIKAFDPSAPNIREFEHAARDALGLSAREVKRLLSGGWKELARDEQLASDESALIIEQLNSINAQLRGGI